MSAMKHFDNLIAGTHTINQDIWVLSLIRKAQVDLGYLVMEGIDETDKRFVKVAHLAQKPSNLRKAAVVYRDLSDNLDALSALGEGCMAYTWNITRFQADDLLALVQAEQQRADTDKINYIHFSQRKASSGLFSAPKGVVCFRTFDASGHSQDNHNRDSWVMSVVQALQLPFRGRYVPFTVVFPNTDRL